ncbi:ABC transporter ATP-binding protein [Jeotgalibacillus haloalkalitolerans]|uniref:ABC transporter ATP-binding protein n=1 Tax=Jeotgalibacillus haloalkalitolerans TaxID=3104292 RepID=A0ABU5KN35_9BACL|nr:ABC transporter ATP-binding protein [Jeotgalibacillus sp. HH7-29]MDZ5712673.1 ABC transporter ATP-binding protein [Jeotgalibacillus sp. HH7-29]
MSVINTKQLYKKYGSVPVVKGIDLTVEKGEIFGFLGRNGAGKSTFINILTGIIHPSAGSFSLFGVSGPNDKAKTRIGVMPDYTSFDGSMTAMGYLRFLSELSGNKASKEKCLAVLKKVGLEGEANKKTGKFSFGMKKKLGIAQAIIHEPELIFLDEPTSGIDAESVIHIHQLIRELNREGKTIFMTSHNLDEVEKLCTRIAIMKDGQIVKIGSMDELRSYYQSTIIVKIKHGKIPSSELNQLKQWLLKTGQGLEMKQQHMIISVDQEKKIADIIRAFNQCKVDIYRVEVEEPSLEEIFLDEQVSGAIRKVM